MSKLLFCLMGPTASGKTDLACHLTQKFPLEIISVDSAMIYRGMDIGTAKPDAATLLSSPHHLIDIIDPPESYSAAQFCEDVHRSSDSILQKGKFPLLVGGTMMYYRALQQGLSSLPEADITIREELLQQATECGWDYMHQWLTQVDPIAAARIHAHDTQRIQRALEVYKITGNTLTEFLHQETSIPQSQFINIRLMPRERSWLHQRIATRFSQMLAAGFIDEVMGLLKKWKLTAVNPSMRSVGYRQVISYLQGEYDYSTLTDKGVAATRQLAKRQLTWLRNWPDGYIVAADGQDVISELMVIIGKILDNSARGC
jgi:tRNA dimethylallyltransferase